MENKAEKAGELFHCGYNCAQAVFAAFAPELGIDSETALKLASSFGGGMGQLREVCGALSALFMVAGIKHGYALPDDPDAKKEHYALVRELAEEFKARNGAILCRELLALQGKTESGHGKSCEDLVRSAAAMAVEKL